MISRIIKDEVGIIYRSRRLRWITQTEALIILDIMRKPSSIIVLLCIKSKKQRTMQMGTRKFHTKLILPPFFLMFSGCSNAFKTIK